LYGNGEVLEPKGADFDSLRGRFPEEARGVRSIIRAEIKRIADSCGYGVPLLKLEAERTQLPVWAERKGSEGLVEYQRKNNATSLDRLPGLRWVNGLK